MCILYAWTERGTDQKPPAAEQSAAGDGLNAQNSPQGSESLVRPLIHNSWFISTTDFFFSIGWASFPFIIGKKKKDCMDFGSKNWNMKFGVFF